MIPMCMKVFKPKSKDFKNFQNIMKEFEILCNLSHPCISKAIKINLTEQIDAPKDINEEEEEIEYTTIAFYVEYLDYGLEKVLTLGIGNTLKTQIVLDVVHAMNYLHKNGIMHRNLKVENIMLNSFSMAKLVDFGLARIEEMVFEGFSFDKETLSLTKGLGTFAYMSPEMAREENYDFKTDVYSFGIVVYCIFTGKLPEFSLKAKMNGKMPEMPKPSDNISQFCIDLITQCLDKSPSKRPSFDEILNLMRENEFKFASDVDFDILSKRDKELEFFENYK